MHNDEPFLDQGIISEVAVIAERFPCFAIPLVYTAYGANIRYIQRCDHKGRVVGFDWFEDPRVQTLPSVFGIRVEIGSPEIFALIDPKGELVTGDRAALSTEVERWIDSVQDPFSVLTFATFAGLRDHAAEAAKSLVEELAEKTDPESARRWLMNAVLVPQLRAEVGAQMSSTEVGTNDLLRQMLGR